MVMSAQHLENLFDPDKYKQLEGHIFEALGKLLDAQRNSTYIP
jgi:hypothetical protein